MALMHATQIGVLAEGHNRGADNLFEYTFPSASCTGINDAL